MNIQNDILFKRLNEAELELILWTLNIFDPGPSVVTLENIRWYRLPTLRSKLDKVRPHIKKEYEHMHASICLKLELHKLSRKTF